MGNGVERNLLVVDFGVFPQIVQDDFEAACMFQTVPTSLINPTIRTWFGDRSWAFGDTWGRCYLPRELSGGFARCWKFGFKTAPNQAQTDTKSTHFGKIFWTLLMFFPGAWEERGPGYMTDLKKRFSRLPNIAQAKAAWWTSTKLGSNAFQILDNCMVLIMLRGAET